jgi:uncharacterized phage protein (TIGR01671 family)
MNNRSLKFRVWDNSINKFINPEHCGFLMNYGLIHGNVKHPTYDLYYNPNMVIQQFTGAVDKNGKEIYDGDIVKVKRSFVRPFINNNHIDYEHVEGGEECGYIVWNCYKWLVSYEHIHYDDFDDFNGIDHRHEVIGNICENPELVKYQWK